MVTRHLRWMATVDLPDLARAIPAAKGMRPATLAAALPETDDLLQRVLALDYSTYMPGSVLTRVDRASMAHGLEVRPPLLDDGMVTLVRLPSRYKLRRGSGKYLLKLAARGKIPDEIIDRRGRVPHPAGELAARAAPRPHRGVSSPARRCSSGQADGEVFRAWNQAHQKRRAATASLCGLCCWITGCSTQPDVRPRRCRPGDRVSRLTAPADLSKSARNKDDRADPGPVETGGRRRWRPRHRYASHVRRLRIVPVLTRRRLAADGGISTHI